MKAVTIPKNMASKDDLVVIPRKEYEALLELRKIREFTPTTTQKRALARARKKRKAGEYLTIDELREKLGLTG